MPEYLAPGVYLEESLGNNTRALFEDISLPASELTKLKNLFKYIQPGNKPSINVGGIRVLFDGPSGRGKTLASNWLSSNLGWPLYRIDIAKIVSKYIGETEKNLERIFKLAEASNTILFFDEADALFGKRTEVRDAQDRYANLDANELLKKIETFKGMVILASNTKDYIDQAFLQSLYTIIHFEPRRPPNLLVRLWRWIKQTINAVRAL